MISQVSIKPFDINQGLISNNEYYVYRLVDPRTLQTFYVGKGKGSRVFDHVRDVKNLISKDEDLTSLKGQQIAEILGCSVSSLFRSEKDEMNDRASTIIDILQTLPEDGQEALVNLIADAARVMNRYTR